MASLHPTCHVLLWALCHEKEKKQNSMYNDLPADEAPGHTARFLLPIDSQPASVTFCPDTLSLPKIQDGPCVMLDGRDFY